MLLSLTAKQDDWKIEKCETRRAGMPCQLHSKNCSKFNLAFDASYGSGIGICHHLVAKGLVLFFFVDCCWLSPSTLARSNFPFGFRLQNSQDIFMQIFLITLSPPSLYACYCCDPAVPVAVLFNSKLFSK